MHELITKTATETATMLRIGEVSPIELVKVLQEHVEQADAVVNALVIRFFDEATTQAERLMAAHPDPEERGLLAGLPVAVKDYNDVAGQPTTSGSPIFADNVALESDAMVRTIERNGGIPCAKSNVPEFAGGHTYNTVFGPTRNPWHTGRSSGGSSGGAAASLASGSAWLATGNDLGGSLRTPAGFNGVVGVRPTAGLVPRRTPAVPFDTLWVEGPMARNVADAALFLDAMVGHDAHDPLTAHRNPACFVRAMNEQDAPSRVAYSPDLGVLPVSREVRATTAGAMAAFEAAGAEVTDECADFTDAYETFQTLRAHLVAAIHGDLLASHRDRIKPDIVWNIELGLNQGLEKVRRAERARGALVHRMADLFTTHDALIVPSAPLAPFPVEWDWPHEIDGHELATYIDWIAITFFISLTGCPVVALPCGLSDDGLPIGIQVVGPPGSEARLLSYGQVIEQAAGIASRLPIAPSDGGVTGHDTH